MVPKPAKYLEVPSRDQWNLSEDADYLYFCYNETVGGTFLIYNFPLEISFTTHVFTTQTFLAIRDLEYITLFFIFLKIVKIETWYSNRRNGDVNSYLRNLQ